MDCPSGKRMAERAPSTTAWSWQQLMVMGTVGTMTRMMTIPGAQEDHGQWWSGVPEQPKQAPWLIKTAGEVEDDLMIMII